MSEQISLTSAVEDARRLQVSAFIPKLLGMVFTLGILACYFWGGPLWWFLVIAAACLILGRMVQHGSPIGALVLALASTAFGLVALIDAVTEAWTWTNLGVIPVALVPAVICWRAVPGAFRLRTRFRYSRPLAAGHRAWRVPRDRRILEAIEPAAACAFYFCAGMIAMFFGAVIARGLGGGFALRPFSRLANQEYRKILQVLSYRAQEVRAQDKRPPVLFFRSFMDEDLTLQRRLGLFIRVLQVSRTLEEVVVDRIWSVGPVIAIGRPAPELSPLGAAREYVHGPGWQSRVTALLDECALAVSVLGETEGLVWEYKRLAAKLTPLLLIVPHGDAEVLLHRWRSFCVAFPAAASIAVPEGGAGDFPLLVWFRPRHEPLVLTCKYQNELSYELAFDDVLFCRGLSRL
jgi:hypothetical protein